MKLKHWSHSQHNLAVMCGEAYRRRYLMGEKLPPGIAALRGRCTHDVQETNLKAKMKTGALLPLEAVADAAADSWKTALQGEFTIDGDELELGKDVALALGQREVLDLSTLHATQVAPAINPTAIEVRIEVPPSEVLPVKFVSILDLIDGGDTIRDTKTKRKSPEKTLADDSDQLTGQHLAFQAKYQKLPSRILLDVLVRTPKKGDLKWKQQETTRSPERTVEWLARVRAMIRCVEAEVFVPAGADSWKCTPKWCGFFPTCPYAAGRQRPTS